MMHTRHLCCILLMAICSMRLSCHASCQYSFHNNPYAVTHIQDGFGADYDFWWNSNGDLVEAYAAPSGTKRRLCWTEDNRLQAYAGFSEDGTVAAWYNYTADGERNLKLTSPQVQITQTAKRLFSTMLL